MRRRAHVYAARHPINGQAYVGLLGSPLFDVGLTNGTTYYYRVTAINADGKREIVGVNNSPVAPPAPAGSATVAACDSFDRPRGVEARRRGQSEERRHRRIPHRAAFRAALDLPRTPSSQRVDRGLARAFHGTGADRADQLRQRVAWAAPKSWSSRPTKSPAHRNRHLSPAVSERRVRQLSRSDA